MPGVNFGGESFILPDGDSEHVGLYSNRADPFPATAGWQTADLVRAFATLLLHVISNACPIEPTFHGQKYAVWFDGARDGIKIFRIIKIGRQHEGVIFG